MDVIARAMFGAGGRTRTDMSVTSPDFESGAYTNFATPAFGCDMIKPVPTQRKLPSWDAQRLKFGSSSALLLRPLFVQNLRSDAMLVSFQVC